jgi:hypothetical protein
LAEEKDTAIREKALEILDILNRIASGEEAKRYANAARKLSRMPMGPNGQSPGIPADFTWVDYWIEVDPDTSVRHLDDIAFLFGESLVHYGAKWKISLSTRHSLIILKSKETLSPHIIVTNRFNDSSFSLLKRFSSIPK